MVYQYAHGMLPCHPCVAILNRTVSHLYLLALALIYHYTITFLAILYKFCPKFLPIVMTYNRGFCRFSLFLLFISNLYLKIFSVSNRNDLVKLYHNLVAILVRRNLKHLIRKLKLCSQRTDVVTSLWKLAATRNIR